MLAAYHIRYDIHSSVGGTITVRAGLPHYVLLSGASRALLDSQEEQVLAARLISHGLPLEQLDQALKVFLAGQMREVLPRVRVVLSPATLDHRSQRIVYHYRDCPDDCHHYDLRPSADLDQRLGSAFEALIEAREQDSYVSARMCVTRCWGTSAAKRSGAKLCDHRNGDHLGDRAAGMLRSRAPRPGGDRRD